MQIVARQNEIEITVKVGQTFYFHPKYLRTTGFAKNVLNLKIGGILPRLLSLRFWDLHICPTNENEKIILSGEDALGNFISLEVQEGETLYIRRFSFIAAYSFESDGKFKSINLSRLIRPMNWLLGTTFGVRLVGPAILVLYGRDISKKSFDSNLGVYADQLVAFDANSKFHPESLSPDSGSLLANFMNTLSTCVSLRFAKKTEVVYSTLREEQLFRFVNLPRLFFGFIFFTCFFRKQILTLFGLE